MAGAESLVDLGGDQGQLPRGADLGQEQGEVGAERAAGVQPLGLSPQMAAEHGDDGFGPLPGLP